jgi:ketosteroid isomerase-like protein
VEIVRASFEAWNAGDMDAYRELYDPDALVRMPEGWPEPGPYFGREAAMRYFKEFRETWDSDSAEQIGEFIDAADRVVVRFVLRGAVRGPEANLDLTTVFTVRKGKILSLEVFRDHAEVLETLGLSKPGASQERGEVSNEVVRRWFWAFEHDAALFREMLHPEIEWFPIEENHMPRYGIEAALQNRNEWLDTWDEHRFDLEEVFKEGDNVVVLVHIVAQGKASRIEVDLRFYAQIKVRDGKIIYIYDHEDRAAALEAAGLSG